MNKNTYLIKSFLAIFAIATLGTANAQYCNSSAGSTADSKCDRVELVGNSVTIDENSSAAGCQTYTDNTSLPAADLSTGADYTVTITQGTCGGNYTRRSNAWIDYNGDGDFTDAGEEYDLGSAEDKANDATSLSPITITIPNDAVLGDVFMRVTTRTTSPFAVTYPTSCENGFVGEVEDYIIQVIDPTASIEDVAFEGFNLFPNPTKGEFTLNLKVVNTDKVSIQLFDVRGRLIDEKKYLNTVANFSERIFFEKASAGLYLLKVTNGNKHTTRKLIIK